MYENQHYFHIPVMGTGHSIDTPIRVAHLGINSVISVVDDLLLEQIRRYYCKAYGFTYTNIPRSHRDGRASRITAYLDMVWDIVNSKFEEVKTLPFTSGNDKDRYFNLLPDINPLKKMYLQLSGITDITMRQRLEKQLTDQMRPGIIEANIMAKVDSLKLDSNDQPMSQEFSDANSALRGFANSSFPAGLVLSAGFNPRLYNYISEFRDFYRDQTGSIRKKIILKVSDFRSALIQGKYLAKKGLEVSEFRIESGLNCGGHAFISDGHLLPQLLREFRDKREELTESFRPLIAAFYESMGWTYPDSMGDDLSPAITVQGGVGTSGEVRRLIEDYGMDSTGWGSPFLLVPEATCVDETTTRLLEESTESDLYLSNVSPLGVPFNNIRGTGSDVHKNEQIKKNKPGSKCPKGFLVSNTEFTESPICTASSQYQLLKLNQIDQSEFTDEKKESLKSDVLAKSCLCTNLGNGALIRLGILKPSYGRQAICPGPNIAWFDRTYTLEEMTDHIYGRRPSLVSERRLHMFAKEIIMYVDYIEELMRKYLLDDNDMRKLEKMRVNLEEGMEECLRISHTKANENENLESLEETVLEQRYRLDSLFEHAAHVGSY